MTGISKDQLLKKIQRFFFLGMSIILVYVLWAIQPQPFDEWSAGVSKWYNPVSLPASGQGVRYVFSGDNFLITSPFSLLRPYSLLTDVVVSYGVWAALGHEALLVRFILTLVTVLGFPYLGQVGTWNLSASNYTVSLVWVLGWFLCLKSCRDKKTIAYGRLLLLGVLSFIASVWHEVWLVSFSVICAFLWLDGYFQYKRSSGPGDRKYILIAAVVLMGYAVALWYYTKGGPQEFLYKRSKDVSQMHVLFGLQHIMASLRMGFKETAVFLKDFIPLFMLTAFIALKDKSASRFSNDAGVLGAMSLGAILFLNLICFLGGPPPWRTRLLCTVPVFLYTYVVLKNGLWKVVEEFEIPLPTIRLGRVLLLAVAVPWFGYNAYRTYFYNNIDVKSWLNYRQMVLDHNPKALDVVAPRTLPYNRPKGCAKGDGLWGIEDDRYRYFYGPGQSQVKRAVTIYWQADKV